MSAGGVSLSVLLDFFSRQYQVYGAGVLGDFLLLNYFRNCEIKNTGLAFFWSLRAILTKIIILHMYMQLMAYFFPDSIE